MAIARKRFFIPLLVLIVLLILGLIYIGSFLSKEDWLSEEKISSQLEEMYEGTVDNLEIKEGVYMVNMTRAGALYVVAVDATSGTVLSMEQLSDMVIKTPMLLAENEVEEIIEEEYEEVQEVTLNKSKEPPIYEAKTVKETEVAVDATNGKIMDEKPQVSSSSPSTLISKERAIEIALGQLQGEIEEVKFENTDDGGFYLIEIEQDNDDDDLEAVIQIHAITGKVLSVIWDD